MTSPVPETLRRLRATASELERIRAPLARSLTLHLFGDEAPEVVSFSVLYAATQERYDERPPRRAAIEAAAQKVRETFPPTRQVEDLLLGDPIDVEAPFTVDDLIGTVIDALRGAADNFEHRTIKPGEPTAELCSYMIEQARLFLLHFVEPAQLVGEQLLVLELARVTGMVEVPYPEALKVKGRA